MNELTTVTGIPIDVLFGLIAALVSAIYLDLRRGQNALQKSGSRRDILLARICERLGISWDGD